MKLSICVVNYHHEEALQKLLGSIVDFPPGCMYEVIVMDNGSADHGLLKQQLEKFGGQVRLVKSPVNQGFAKASNRAVKLAKGDMVLLCNPDIEVLDGSLRQLLKFADEQGDFGLIGSRLLNPDGSVQASARRFPKLIDLMANRLSFVPGFSKRSKSYLLKSEKFTKPTQVDWMVGAVMLMRKERFQEIGGFDERFFIFFEDTDLCRRLSEAGHEVWYHPQSQMLHSEERLSQRGFWPLKKVFWIHLGSAMKYFWKWRGKGS